MFQNSNFRTLVHLEEQKALKKKTDSWQTDRVCDRRILLGDGALTRPTSISLFNWSFRAGTECCCQLRKCRRTLFLEVCRKTGFESLLSSRLQWPCMKKTLIRIICSPNCQRFEDPWRHIFSDPKPRNSILESVRSNSYRNIGETQGQREPKER